MRAPTFALAVAVLASIGTPGIASAGSHVEKVYAANGRRVAVIKDTAFGRKLYGQDGRRIATIRKR